jgi:transcriptional regulator with XRE-family HTH domain
MTNGLNSDIGSRLRDERKRLGLSMSQAAVLVGLSSRTYIKIEHGAREITDLEAKLLRENGFQMDWIVTGDSEMLAQPGLTVSKSVDRSMRRKIAELSELKQQSLDDAIESLSTSVHQLISPALGSADDATFGRMIAQSRAIHDKIEEACRDLGLKLSSESIDTLALIGLVASNREMPSDFITEILRLIRREMDQASAAEDV